jgi:Zn-dependent M28 family amino/carboxypeptidase
MKTTKFLISGIVLVVVVAYGLQRRQTPSSTPIDTPFNGDRAFEDLKKIVGFGPRPAGSEALAQTRGYILAELQKAGLTPIQDRFEGHTPKGVIPMINIRAIRQGTGPTTIAITGHYDTKRFDGFRFDGANDGGSSAAWVLEMARATTGLKLQNSLEFVFFDGEEALLDWTETDSVYGSRYDLDRRYKAGDLQKLKALILVDMIGDKSLNIKRESGSTAWLTDIVWNTAHSAGYSQEFVDDKLLIEDDHVPFLHAGIPAVDLIDFDYGPSHSYWHTAGDTLDKTSARSLKVVGDVVYSALPEIDKKLQ